MPAVLDRRSLLLFVVAALVLFADWALVVGGRGPSIAAAQSGGGSINGRVLWNGCVRIPLPLAPASIQSGASRKSNACSSR